MEGLGSLLGSMGYTGIMEKKMGTAIVYWGQMGFRAYLEGQGDFISRLIMGLRSRSSDASHVHASRLKGSLFQSPELGILTFRCFFTGSG